jgi:hypothetical protein
LVIACCLYAFCLDSYDGPLAISRDGAAVSVVRVALSVVWRLYWIRRLVHVSVSSHLNVVYFIRQICVHFLGHYFRQLQGKLSVSKRSPRTWDKCSTLLIDIGKRPRPDTLELQPVMLIQRAHSICCRRVYVITSLSWRLNDEVFVKIHCLPDLSSFLLSSSFLHCI